MKPYPAYKDSGVEWIGEIPEHWNVIKLKHIVQTVQTGITPPSNNLTYYENGDVDWFTPSDFNGSLFLTNSNRKITNMALVDGVAKLFDANSVFLVGIGATLGKIGIVKNKSSCNQQINAIRFKDNYSYYFGAYYLQAISNIIVSLSKASTLAILNQFQTKEIIMVLPSFEEQESIIKYLNNKTSQIDTLIEKKQKQIELLKEERTAIINQAVTKGLNPDVPMKDSGIEWLGEVPEHWIIKKLKYLADQSREKKETYGSLKVGLENIEGWTGRLINLELENVFESEGIVFNQEDILFGKLRPYLAKVHKAQEAGICVSEILVLKPNNLVTSDFLYYRCLSEDFIKEVNSSTYGSKMPRANWDFIGNLSIPFPTISEQNSITNLIGSSIDKSNRLIEVIQQQITILEEYRTALISNAVTGKIDVRGIATAILE